MKKQDKIDEIALVLKNTLSDNDGFLLLTMVAKNNDDMDMHISSQSTPQDTSIMVLHAMQNSNILEQVFINSVFTYIKDRDSRQSGYLNDMAELLKLF